MSGKSLEQYIKDFVLEKTAETVELQLRDHIRVKHVTRKGSTILAILWANVLQHENNFPQGQYEYKKLTDRSGTQKLILDAHDPEVVFTVNMSNGTLIMQGPYVYEWFTKKFTRLLNQYDEDFALSWHFDVSALDKPSTSNKYEDLEPALLNTGKDCFLQRFHVKEKKYLP